VDGDRAGLPGEGLPGLVVAPASLDDLTDLDRRIIVALQQNGRASWTSVAEVVGSSSATVLRRGQQLLAGGVVSVTVQPAIGSLGPTDLFLTRINCRPGRQREVAERLASWSDVRFLSVVSGRYDIVAEVAVRGGASHYSELISPLQQTEGVERWRSDLLLHVYKVGHDWSRQLFNSELAAAHDPARAVEGPPGAPSTCVPEHLDDVDRRILEVLAPDGRATFQKVAADVGLNESNVRRRFERMRAQGCADVLTLVPAAALGMGAETLITVRVRPGRLSDVAASLAAHSAVRYVAALLDDSSLLCEVIAGSNESLWQFVNETLATLDGVQGWDASMELLQLKRGFTETPWWRGQVRQEPDVLRSPAGSGAWGCAATP